METNDNKIAFKAVHPLETVKDELKARGLTQKQFAQLMGMQASNVSRMFKSHADITIDLAERLEKALDIPAEFWLSLQTTYNKTLKTTAQSEQDKVPAQHGDTFTHKGFTGTIEVDEAGNCLRGRILAIRHDGDITYTGNTVPTLRENFHKAVDSFIAECAAQGIDPHKSYSGNLNVRVSPETHSNIAILASRAGMSINAFVRQLISRQVMLLM